MQIFEDSFPDDRNQTHTVIRALLLSMMYLLWTANQVSVHDRILIDCVKKEFSSAPLEFNLIAGLQNSAKGLSFADIPSFHLRNANCLFI